jgi:hypothetical protein
MAKRAIVSGALNGPLPGDDPPYPPLRCARNPSGR